MPLLDLLSLHVNFLKNFENNRLAFIMLIVNRAKIQYSRGQDS